MRKIGNFRVHDTLYVEEIGFHHNTLHDLRVAGFIKRFDINLKEGSSRSATLVPAEGVSLDLLFEALDAALLSKELPALPVRATE